jgi:hypothetical protein
MEDGDREALERLADLVGRTSPLVLAGVPAPGAVARALKDITNSTELIRTR